jgi:glycosyltransferase involved in cell wall biosynthesis
MARLLYDLTGLLHWYAYFGRPAGVQRVIEQVGASAVLQEAAGSSTSQARTVEFVVRILGSDRFYRVDHTLLPLLSQSRAAAMARLRRLFTQGMRLASGREIIEAGRYFHLPYLALGLAHLERLLAPADRSSPSPMVLQPVEPPTAEDAYFNPGDLWWQNDYAAALAGLKKRTGVRIVQMIHDLYVLQRPEWSPRGFSAVFARQFRGIAPHVDGWLTSSAYVKGQVESCLESWSLPVPPVAVLPMGWDSFDRGRLTALVGDQAILDRHGIGQEPFILFVGTVEPRKNLSALLNAMEGVRAEVGEKVPALVVAGGYGWRAPTVRRRLQQGVRQGHLFWVRNPGDEELRAFYRRARFTVMPSHGEGWGLAVQESIALGAPCIASSGGATPEAGRDLATYFDPARPGDLETVMASWIVRDAALAEARARIERALRTETFATWNDAGNVLLACAFGQSPPPGQAAGPKEADGRSLAQFLRPE